MNTKKSNETRAKSPDRLILKLASGDPVQNGQWIQSQPTGTQSPFLWRIYPSNGADYAKAFVSLQGQGSGFTIGKGPPGLSPDTGGGAGRDPDNKAGPPLFNTQAVNTIQQTDILKIIKKQQTNFLQTLIFTIMKKQILILVVAIFATTTVFGQMVHNSNPVPLVCTSGPTAPLAGVPYNYAVTSLPAGGDYQWWATKNLNFISTVATVTTNNSAGRLTVGTDLIAAGANYGIAGGATNAANVDITWSSATLVGTTVAAPTFVVVQYDAVAPNCANNLKVYPIIPVNGFTVDIKNMTQAAVPVALYTDPVSVCVSDIETATYVAPNIVTDYGTNVLYFEVVASNFTGGYTPSFTVTGLQAGQTVTSLELAVATTFAAPIATVLTAGEYSPAAPVTVDPSVTNTTTGVSLYVRLTIDNGTHEHLADTSITLAVNGTNAAGQDDVVNSACATVTDFEDTAVQTLTLRPTVLPVAATGAFIP